MAQHDMVIANDSGANVRADLNNALAALVSMNSGATAPSTVYAGMLWYDTTLEILKVRDSGDTEWIPVIDVVNYPSPFLEETPDDQEASGLVAKMTYGNTVTVGDVLYMASDGHLEPADANDSSKMPVVALALEAGSDGDSKKVLLKGFYRDDILFNFATVGGKIYASGTVGEITQTRPSAAGDQPQVIGFATHADRIFFSPEPIKKCTKLLTLPAAAFTPSETNGCVDATSVELGATDKKTIYPLEFEVAADSYAEAVVTFPDTWDGGTIKFKFKGFSETAEDAGDVITFGMQGVAVGDDEDVDTAYGTAQVAVATIGATPSTSKLVVSAASPAITIAGSPADGDSVLLRIYRDVATGGTDGSYDFYLTEVLIQYTVNDDNEGAW